MRFIAKTLYGLENVLAKELSDLGAGDISIGNRAVFFSGSLELMYTVNYMSRTAVAVLLTLSEFKIRSADDLYNTAQKIEWEKYMSVEDTFSVIPVIKSKIFTHTGYAGLKLKDSIADYFRKKYGSRPSVDASDPTVLVNLHISNDRVTVSLDSSLSPLFKRGYRQEMSAAPLNEVLAAGLLLISGWNTGTTIIDPMCGSGTIPIEAGMIATDTPPGKYRKGYGFQRWKNFDAGLFNMVREIYDSKIKPADAQIFGYDISEQATEMAKKSVKTAGLEKFVKVETIDFRDLRPKGNEGVIIMNPPYGERLNQGETDELYGMIGSTLKHQFPGYTAWIISSNKDSLKHIGLKPKEKHILYNGALECLFLKYELYQGSKKKEMA
jgi:putative N6-adenine-specific DNA methylase